MNTERSLHITILQGAFFPVPPVRGGAVEKAWHSLGQEFAARGHKVTHLSRWCDGLPEHSVEQGVSHIRVRGYDQPASGLVLKVRDLQYSLRVCRKVPPSDIIVTNTFWSPLLLRRFAAKLYVIVERMPKGQMRLYRHAARLRASTRAVEEAIFRDDAKAVGRTKVVPNPLPWRELRAIDWMKKEATLLFVGRLHPEKGIELLLEAFSLAKREGELRDWKLQLVGPASARAGGGGETWANSLRSRFANPDIVWNGPIYDSRQLSAIYERAKVFVYPSLAERGETFGIAPLEAMAWGAVPIVSSLACFQDYIQHKTNGLRFDHRSADPARSLADEFISASRMDLAELGSTAALVRQTHGPGRIAELFLEDFLSLAQ